MDFKVGDRVRFLDEEGWAIVLKVNAKEALVKDSDGFERTCPLIELVKHRDIKTDHISIKAIDLGNRSINRRGNSSLPIIDLHIENLVDSHRDMSNHEIVTKQLQKFSSFLVSTKTKKENRIIVIHGVGEGVLKREIKEIILGMPGAEMYDADYLQFGRGASVIERKFNIKY
ncbi:MAG: hypothetical protein ACI9XP_000615 [Lentimonas sp.]|jgi:hypothetical protein